jgi:membrane-bound metal-dependent hydrolase YbcI (DUF457 family)
MTLPSHIILGAVIGGLTGDYKTSIIVSVFVDLDHLVSYVKSGVIVKPKKFFKTITAKDDPYGDQRGFLHNVVVAGVISGLTFLVSIPFGSVFTLAYLGHLLLDAFDKSDYWPLYPFKGINITGFIDYFSWKEILFDFLMLVVLFLVILL